MSPRWQYKSILTPLPVTKTTYNYLWTRYHWENPEIWGWGWCTPCNTEIRTDCIQWVRGMVTQWLHCPFRGWYSTTLRCCLWVNGYSRGKREPIGYIHQSQCYGSLYENPILSHPTEIIEICGDQSLGIWLWWRGASNNQHLDLGSQSSYLQRPSCNTNQWVCSSARPSQWDTLTKEMGKVKIYLIWVLKARA